MQKLIYAIAAILVLIGIILLCFSHVGFKYHVHETLVALGPINIGSDADLSAPFSPVYGGMFVALGIVLAIFNYFKR